MPQVLPIQIRRGTAAEWTSVDPVLLAGEIGLETDTLKLKVGDGSTAWSSLAYLTSGGGGVTDHGALTGLADDDHPQYQKESEKDAANGYAGLSAGTKLAGAQQTYGTGSNTACEGNDSRLSDARTPTAHASSHAEAGSDRLTTVGLANTGLNVRDTDDSHELGLVPGSNLSANRTLTLVTGDADRTLTLSGDATLSGGAHSGTNTGDQTISLTGDVTGSGTGSFAATIANDAVTDAKLRESAAVSVIGRAANTGGNPADIAAASNGTVLRRLADTLAFGDVTDACLRDSSGVSVIGRGANSVGKPADIVAGADGDVLRRVGGALAFGALSSIAVTSLTGTTNQVIASAATGAVALSTPQDIHTSATPQFAGLGIGATGEAGIVNLVNAGTAPTTNLTNGVRLYAEDVSSSSELKVRDEAGNITTLSPHNFSLLGGPSEPMAWAYYSERDVNGRLVAINVDLLRVARLLERLTGEKLVMIQELEPCVA